MSGSRFGTPERPSISLVMPCLNGGAYVAEAIESALTQTCPPDEIIVVDDGSTDDSAARIKAFGERVSYHYRPHEGMCAARNRGVALSSGDLLAFLDVDDVWTKDSLELRLDLLRSDEAAAYSYGAVDQFYCSGLDAETRSSFSANSLLSGRLAGSMLIRRSAWELVGGLDEGLRAGEMVNWVARSAAKGLHGVSTEAVVLKRRIHASNSVHQRAQHGADHLRALRSAVELKRAGSR